MPCRAPSAKEAGAFGEGLAPLVQGWRLRRIVGALHSWRMGVAFGEELASSAQGWRLRQRIGALGAVLAPSLQGGCLIQSLRMFTISHQQSKQWKVD